MATFSSGGIYAAELHVKPTDTSPYSIIWRSAATISNAESHVYLNSVEDTSVLSGSDTSTNNIQKTKVFAPGWAYAGKDCILAAECDIEGKHLTEHLLIHVDELPRDLAAFDEDVYAAEFHIKSTDSLAVVLIWNSAATIANPTSKLYLNGIENTAVMSGVNTSSQNVQTSKVFTPTSALLGKCCVLSLEADIEDKHWTTWILVHVDGLVPA